MVGDFFQDADAFKSFFSEYWHRALNSKNFTCLAILPRINLTVADINNTPRTKNFETASINDTSFQFLSLREIFMTISSFQFLNIKLVNFCLYCAQTRVAVQCLNSVCKK